MYKYIYVNGLEIRRDDSEKEIYIVRVGIKDTHARPTELENRIKSLEKILDRSVNGYTNGLQSSNCYENRRFHVVVDSSLSGVVTELVYPTNSVMPDSFLFDIIEKFKEPYADKQELGKERGYLIQHLAENGWNPRLAMERKISSMIFYGGNKINYCMTLPSFMWEFWDNYQKKNNIPDDVKDIFGNYINGPEKFHGYCQWVSEFQKNNPGYTLKNWEDEKETIEAWTRIR